MDNTLDRLPGEGDVKVTTYKRVRKCCDNCGEPAHYLNAFLLPNFRNNPASTAYGRDDCSWCEDERRFSCKDPNCQRDMRHLDGYVSCSTFPASERFAHMFLVWEIQKEEKEV